MTDGLSEHARQLYEAILEEGFVSPDHTWELFCILDLLCITSPYSHDWLRELEQKKLIVRVPSKSITLGDQFYAVPPAGYKATRSPGQLTIHNIADHYGARQKRTAGTSDESDQSDEAFGELGGRHTAAHGDVVINNNFIPSVTQTAATPSPARDGAASLWSAWGTWLSVALAVVAILVSLFLAGKL